MERDKKELNSECKKQGTRWRRRDAKGYEKNQTNEREGKAWDLLGKEERREVRQEEGRDVSRDLEEGKERRRGEKRVYRGSQSRGRQGQKKGIWTLPSSPLNREKER